MTELERPTPLAMVALIRGAETAELGEHLLTMWLDRKIYSYLQRANSSRRSALRRGRREETCARYPVSWNVCSRAGPPNTR